MKLLSREQALVAMLALFWGVFATADYALCGHALWLGIIFGCTVIASIFTCMSTLAEKINGGRGGFDDGLIIMYGLRVIMTVIFSLMGMYFICLAGIRLFA